jgi:hypothetical protein
MMAEMIATYSPPSGSPTASGPAAVTTKTGPAAPPTAGGYLNEVRQR